MVSHGLGPVDLIATLAHPLVKRDDEEGRRAWLRSLRAFDRKLRGPTPAPGLEPLREIAQKAGEGEWWETVEAILSPLIEHEGRVALADVIDAVASVAEVLAGDAVWSREDGRALSAMVDDLRHHARQLGTIVGPEDMNSVSSPKNGRSL